MENINIEIVVAKKFMCETCDYECSAKGNLKRHVKSIHLKLKEFECDQCDYKCSANHDLKMHVKCIHLKLKDVECIECDFKCSTNGELKKHIKQVHDKTKDFLCSQCDYKCSTNGNLKSHVKQVHLKLKDFECKQCDYKCSDNNTLKKHVRDIHDNPKMKNMSRGETSVFNHLIESGYEFNKTFFREVTFNDLRGIGDGLLRYDFKVMIDDNKFVLIEFDGEQHFRPVKFHSTTTAEQALEAYKLTKTHDRIKNDYCNDNGIELLRIKYDQVVLVGVMITEFIKVHS